MWKRHTSRRTLLRCLLLACTMLAAGMLTGCQQALFIDGEQRSQYGRYQEQHGDYRPETEEGPFGIERPALRRRLRPLGTQ